MVGIGASFLLWIWRCQAERKRKRLIKYVKLCWVILSVLCSMLWCDFLLRSVVLCFVTLWYGMWHYVTLLRCYCIVCDGMLCFVTLRYCMWCCYHKLHINNTFVVDLVRNIFSPSRTNLHGHDIQQQSHASHGIVCNSV